LMPQKPKRWGIAYLIIFGAQLVALCALILSDYRHWQIGWPWSSLLVLVVVSPSLFRWYMRRGFGVRCPSCGKPLAGEDAGIALYSGYCWHCHKKIISEKAEPSDGANAALGAPRSSS
jgi:hypothetical protein